MFQLQFTNKQDLLNFILLNCNYGFTCYPKSLTLELNEKVYNREIMEVLKNN